AGGVFSWNKSGTANVIAEAAHQGTQSLQLLDTNAGPSQVEGHYSELPKLPRGTISVWLRRGADQAGPADTLDLYLCGDGAGEAVRKAAIGLGGNGAFHYWGGNPSATFVEMNGAWTANTWYLATIQFNTLTDAFNVSFRDAAFVELDSASNVPFANNATYIDTSLVSANGAQGGSSVWVVDDLRMQPFLSPEPTTFVEAPQSM
ncbi:MAG TPA: hypothetical protein VNH84_13310, partial [Candidatus Saccharimonadales bacterium]|nr:hypothetical protein [Candidatus Saccharimonadales bacterium]